MGWQLIHALCLEPGEGKHISVRPNSNPPNAYFIFICFHLQLAFHDLYNVFCFVNPLAPGAFWQKMHFLDILGILRLDIGRGQISFNLVKKSSAT